MTKSTDLDIDSTSTDRHLKLADEAAAAQITGLHGIPIYSMLQRLEQAVRSLVKDLADMTDWRNELLQRLNKADLLNDGELQNVYGLQE